MFPKTFVLATFFCVAFSGCFSQVSLRDVLGRLLSQDNIGSHIEELLAGENSIAQKLIDFAVRANLHGMDSEEGSEDGPVASCKESSREFACRLFQMATNASSESQLVLMPLLTSLKLGNLSQATTAVGKSPLVTIGMMCSVASSNQHKCLPNNLMRRMIAMANANIDNQLLLVDQFVLSDGENRSVGIDFLCRRKTGNCAGVAQLCRRSGGMRARNADKASEGISSPSWNLLSSVAQMLDIAGRGNPTAILDKFGLGRVRCRVKKNGPKNGRNNTGGRRTTFWTERTTELPLPPNVLPQETTSVTVARTLDISQMDWASILLSIRNWYSQVESELRSIFASFKTSKATSQEFSRQVRQVLQKAWQGRLLLEFPTPDLSIPVVTTPQPGWVPYRPFRPGYPPHRGRPDRRRDQHFRNHPRQRPFPPPHPRQRRQANYYSCSYDVIASACQLLSLNNDGTAFLLPWILEDLYTGSQTSAAAQASTPLAVAIAVCSGRQASTYFGGTVCPSASLFRSAAQAASLTYSHYVSPTYISSIVGNPSYARYGKPSAGHFVGNAVDYLCGAYVYSPPADDTCPRLSGNCYKSSFRNTFFLAQSDSMGCGNLNILPITATHCSH